MEILFADGALLVCVKPSGVLSTDEPGGVPELVREALGDTSATARPMCARCTAWTARLAG